MADSDGELSPIEVVHDYNTAEQELQDQILQVFGSKETDVDLFRPCLAEQQKVGFFSLDRSSQTDVTEIVDLKEMTEVIQILLQDVSNLRKDIHFAKHVMQADYENKLQQKSTELYCRINERVGDLEKVHEDRVGTVRKAFRQQLADALARIHTLYKQKLARVVENMKAFQSTSRSELGERMRELQNQVVHSENVIKMLRLQLQQAQQQEASSKGTPVIDPYEFEEMQQKLEALEKKNARLVEALEIRDEQTNNHNKELGDLQDQLEREHIMLEQLKHENKDLKNSLKQSQDSGKSKLDELETQRKELEKMFEDRLNAMKGDLETQRAELEKEFAEKHQRMKKFEVEGKTSKSARAGSPQISQILDAQRKELEKEFAEKLKKIQSEPRPEPEKSATPVSTGHSAELSQMAKREAQLKEEISQLKKEMEKINRSWEKKFSILQASLYALKDESYLRQTLQRQAATLHQASVSYSADTPVGISGIMPTGKSTVLGSPKKPLPDIGRRSGATGTGHGPEKDYISYTVSAPSGRGTNLFSVDENQVVSDNDEDIPDDVLPLPEPPQRRNIGSADSRPSNHSQHVVVLPSVAAQ